jgi:major membrane immunogen (membrane-anchored lipoprotein)
MRKIILLVVGLAALLSFTACGSNGVADGIYFAQAKEFAKSGWLYQLVVEYKNQRIVRVEWNGTNNLGLPDKRAYSRSGQYGMENVATAGSWHDQAAKVEAFLLEKQNIDAIKLNANNTTDAISGATIKVNEFVELYKQAIAGAPIPKGNYKKDGWYYAAGEFNERTGWKDTALITVVNGLIVDAVWNAVSNNPDLKSKLLESIAGTYGMESTAKEGPWHEQVYRVQVRLMARQDPDKIPVENGKTDSISGATITISGFLDLVKTALATAR